MKFLFRVFSVVALVYGLGFYGNIACAVTATPSDTDLASVGYVASVAVMKTDTASSTAFGIVKTSENIANNSGVISVPNATPTQRGAALVGEIPSGSATATTYAKIWVGD